MKNSKTKIVTQQQMYVTVSERKVEKLKQLTEVFSDCLIDDKITPYVSGLSQINNLLIFKNEKH
jgi:hypothetical protein